MFLSPKQAKFTNSFLSIKSVNDNPKIFYAVKHKYGCLALIASESGKVSNFQQEAVRRFLRRFFKKKAQIFFRIFPSNPITKKLNDTRQGRGKGNVSYWASCVRKGDLLLEIRGSDIKFSKNILNAVRAKFSVKSTINNQQLRWIL